MAAATKDKEGTGLHVVGEESEADAKAIEAANAAGDAPGKSDDERSLEELADEPKPTPPMQIAIPGTRDTIPGRMGGMRPTSSEMRVMGGRVPIEGVFEKGEVLTLIVEVKVNDCGEVDTSDEWGNVQKTVRYHKARLLSVKRVNA